VKQLRTGLWGWTARHPDWTPEQGGPDGWGPDVQSYAYDAGEQLVLLDPLSPPPEVERLAEGKDVVVLLTCMWHARSAPELVERFGADVYAPQERHPDRELAATAYAPGDALPGGVEAKAALFPDEAILWIPAARALMVGESLLGDGALRTPPDAWLGERTQDDVKRALSPLLELPVELLLLGHGEPLAENARERLRAVLA
jgi:hypothetical protein